MSRFSFQRKGNQRPVILHFASWYPTKGNHVEGIFIQRQVELLASDNRFQHIVVRKSNQPVSVSHHLKILAGFFESEQIGHMQVITLPEQSKLYRKYFWRHQQAIEEIVLNKLFMHYQPRLIHLHVVYGFAKEALWLKKNKQVPFIASEHMGPFPFDWLDDKEGVVSKPIKEASAVVAVSTAQAGQIEIFTGRKPQVIPNVVDENAFQFEESSKRETARSSFQLVFVGIYTKAKGVDYLLQVFPDFLKVYPNSKLNLVGDASAERMKALKALVEKNGIEEHVAFHGRLPAESLSKLHHQCDFYVCSSEWESFGLSALEALFTGLPVISTNCGGVTDFICSENGLLIENDQQQQTLLKGLLQMAQQLPSYKRKEIAGTIRNKFSNRVIKENYLAIYDRVLENVKV
jgi:glycosyltransferase involved in cell wall biosynthesis